MNFINQTDNNLETFLKILILYKEYYNFTWIHDYVNCKCFCLLSSLVGFLNDSNFYLFLILIGVSDAAATCFKNLLGFK